MGASRIGTSSGVKLIEKTPTDAKTS